MRGIVHYMITHADDSRGSKAFSCVCDSASVCLSVCLSVCPHDKTKTAETEIAKLGREIVHHASSPITRLKVKVARSQSAKRRSSGRREVCTLSSAQPLVFIVFADV